MFRRKQDEEDPFAALKEAAERGSTHVVGSAKPAAAGDQLRSEPRPLVLDEAATSLRVPQPPPSRRGSDRLLALLFVLLALGGAGALVWQSERDADEQAIAASDRPDGDDATSGGGTDDERSDADDGRASDPRRLDLVRPAGFTRALRAIRGELRPGERVRMLRVARDRIDAFTALPDGDQRLVDVADDLSVTARDAGQAGAHTPLPLTRIDPRAPSRAIRGAVARGGMPAARFDYMVLTGLPAVFGQAPDWSLFFGDVAQRDRHWTAPLSGAPVTRPGERTTTTRTTTSSSSGVTITRNGRTTTVTGADALRISRCVQRAGTDGAAIQRCLP